MMDGGEASSAVELCFVGIRSPSVTIRRFGAIDTTGYESEPLSNIDLFMGGHPLASVWWQYVTHNWALASMAGMMTFLAVIDLAYFAQHGMFAPERDGVMNAFLVVALLALAATLVGVGLT